MYKALLGVGVVIGLVTGAFLLWPTKASADAGPHGNYDLNTSACAGCHRAHTAAAAELLFESDQYALCTTCHGGLTDTNVVDGILEATGNPRLNAGGFEFVAGAATTSTHTVEGLPVSGTPSAGEGTAWGGASEGLGVEGVLECTSCHNPHGSTNYRILRDSHNGYPYTDADCGDVSGCAANAHKWVPDDPDLLVWVDEQVLATVDDTPNYAAGDNAYYTSGILSFGNLPDPTIGMSAFCSTCHKQYLAKQDSAENPSTDPAYYFYPGTQSIATGQPSIARYRHAMTVTETQGELIRPLRLASRGSDQVNAPTYEALTCLSCHFAHGTSAVMEDWAVTEGVGPGVPPSYDSALLYYDNRGVCMACHQGASLAP